MNATLVADRAERSDVVDIVLRATGVTLALGAAWIHWSLGSLLYTLNAIGFATLAAGLVVPFELVIGPRAGRALRTLVRLGLLGFAAATITGWVLIGARITLGYEATVTEAAIALVMVASIARSVGGPVAIARELLGLIPPALRRAA